VSGDEYAALHRESAAQRETIAELQRRLSKDSSNSSKPPSSDGLRKRARIAGSLRGKSDKKSGGQVGHKGGTLKRVANPDRAEPHRAQCCRHCQTASTSQMIAKS
jgi:transposase